MTATLVQSKAGTTTSPTSLTVTLGSPTTAGNCLVVCLGLFGASANPTVTGITLGGSAGNFSSANTAYNNADTNAAIWADPSCAGGQTSVAITCTGSSGSTQICAWVMEFSGVATSSPVDKAPAGANGDSTAWSSGSTGTLGHASEVVIGCGAGTQTPATPGTPWTELAVEAGGSQLFLAAAYQVVSATTALTYNGTTSSSSFWGSCIVTLLATSSSVTGTAAVTQAPLTVGASGGTEVTGTGTVTQAPLTAAASGGIAAAGTVAVTQAPLTVSAEGTATPPPLQLSIAPAGGTDEYGNEYLPGVVVYTLLGGTLPMATQLEGSSIFWYSAPAVGGPYTPKGGITVTVVDGDLEMYIQAGSGPNSTINLEATTVTVNGTPIS